MIGVKLTGYFTMRASWLRFPEFRQAMRDRGIELCEQGPHNAVLHVVELCNNSALIETDGVPVIILDTSDPVSPWNAVRELLPDPNVKAVLRAVVMRSISKYHELEWTDPHHMATYNAVAGDPRRKHEPVRKRSITDAQAAKIKLAFPSALLCPSATERFFGKQPWPVHVPLAERTYDVGFIGQLCYSTAADRAAGYAPAPELHRELMLHQLRKLENLDGQIIETNCMHAYAVPYAWIDNDRFLKLISQLRVLVSPWGWSAWSHRDCDAITCGCVLIKPACDDVRTIPDLYLPTESFLYHCAPDFSNLPDIVRQVVDLIKRDPERWQAKVDANLHRLKETVTVQAVADRFASAIKEALES